MRAWRKDLLLVSAIRGIVFALLAPAGFASKAANIEPYRNATYSDGNESYQSGRCTGRIASSTGSPDRVNQIAPMRILHPFFGSIGSGVAIPFHAWGRERRRMTRLIPEKSHFGRTVGSPPGLPGGGMTGVFAPFAGGAFTPESISGGGQMTPFESASLSLRLSFLFADKPPCLSCSDGLALRRASIAGSEHGFGPRAGAPGDSVRGDGGGACAPAGVPAKTRANAALAFQQRRRFIARPP